MTQWGTETVERIAAEVRKRRQLWGLSAQALADRTKELGHEVSRNTISDLENGRRGERLMLVDALILAAALDLPLGRLVYPDQPHGLVEALPGKYGTSVSAADWMGRGNSIVDLDGGTVWPDIFVQAHVDYGRGFVLQDALLDIEGDWAVLNGDAYSLSDAGREVVLNRFAEKNRRVAKVLALLADADVNISDDYLKARHYDEGLGRG